ncbi:MAG: metal ABC transporter ATP-binding protein [Oscillospiraceae bacterium]|nr:metal ABC transporter ATP-binding protein [Oscillospiraceae bacterium]
MSLIKTTNLTLSYENMTVIKDLNFEVSPGDYLCIVGENGSGKSTLVKALLGLKKPVGGSIEFGDGLWQNEIGYLPQQTNAQRDFPASVYEVVISGCLNSRGIRPFYSARERGIAAENMKRLGISELKNRSYRELSGGQQQRVLLARALCATRKILLLDEPVTGLDPMVTAEFYGLISQINRDGVTVIMVTHDMSAAVKYASHILCMREDDFFFGKTEEFLKSDASDFLKGGDKGV